jgi:hypothetical protein
VSENPYGPDCDESDKPEDEQINKNDEDRFHDGTCNFTMIDCVVPVSMVH